MQGVIGVIIEMKRDHDGKENGYYLILLFKAS